MQPSKLYVIGNGFDLYHKIPSSFNQFKQYVKACDTELFDAIEEYLPVDNWWSDLEESFAHIDIDQLAENALSFLQPYNSEDWSDSYHHDYQFEITKAVDLLSSKLVERFSQWIYSLKIPTSTDLAEPLLGIDSIANFFSFNYTNTLNKVYGVADEEILFIHGKVEDEWSDIVLGHAWEPKEIPSLNNYVYPENIDARIMEGNDILDGYFGETFKPITSLILANSKYFESLSDVNDVYILGHSLSEVDIEYFIEIVKSVNRSARWYVSYYGPEELDHHKIVTSNLGIPTEQTIFFELTSGIPKLNKPIHATAYGGA